MKDARNSTLTHLSALCACFKCDEFHKKSSYGKWRNRIVEVQYLSHKYPFTIFTQFCQTPGLGIDLGVDFTLTWQG